MKKATKLLVTSATLAAALSASTATYAQGVIGGLINQIAPGVGTELDRINHKLGNPVEHAVSAGADAVVPGAGRALELGWRVQRGGGMLGMTPDTPPVNTPVMQLPPPRGGHPPLGSVCVTPAGNFSGPLTPLGMPCQAWTPVGIVVGFVAR